MHDSLSTGEAARLLGVTEPQVNDLIRRGRLCAPPPVRAGRRLWGREHLLQAAEALGVLTQELRARLGEEVSRG